VPVYLPHPHLLGRGRDLDVEDVNVFDANRLDGPLDRLKGFQECRRGGSGPGQPPPEQCKQ
jgi:hypothetical protein